MVDDTSFFTRTKINGGENNDYCRFLFNLGLGWIWIRILLPGFGGPFRPVGGSSECVRHMAALCPTIARAWSDNSPTTSEQRPNRMSAMNCQASESRTSDCRPLGGHSRADVCLLS